MPLLLVHVGAGIALLGHPCGKGGAHVGYAGGVCGVGGKVMQFPRVALKVVELNGGTGGETVHYFERRSVALCRLNP